jgi:hypothetical protein
VFFKHSGHVVIPGMELSQFMEALAASMDLTPPY